jgi:hypothetical protein
MYTIAEALLKADVYKQFSEVQFQQLQMASPSELDRENSALPLSPVGLHN